MNIFRCACAALAKGLKFKLRELNPSGSERLALADTKVKSPDGENVGGRRYREINVETATHFGYLLPRTAPQTTVLYAQAECLRVFSDGALYGNTMREPVFIAMDFVVLPLVFQDSDGRAVCSSQPSAVCQRAQ
jgi:hypothetical protein